MNYIFRRLVTLALSLFLIGCNLTTSPTPAPVGTCDQADLVAPSLRTPNMWETISTLTPTFSWNANDLAVPYPYDDCAPFGYKIVLKEGPLFNTDIGIESHYPSVHQWTPTTPLQPGKAYEWSVAPFVGTGTGPFADASYFFTGPVCPTADLVAPVLLAPIGATMTDAIQPLLIWDYPNPCVPEGYRVDLSTDPSFEDTSLSGGTGNPSTRWLPGTDLTDCTWYYWRVAAINGTTLGPFSNTRSFMINLTGECVYPIPTNTPLVLVDVPPVSLIPTFTLTQNANCRFGDSTVFEARTSYLLDQMLTIEGRNDRSTWLYALMPGNGKNYCWVSLSTGILNVDPSILPIIASPATPVPTTTGPSYNSCQDYKSESLCKSDPAKLSCEWSPNNVCVKK